MVPEVVIMLIKGSSIRGSSIVVSLIQGSNSKELKDNLIDKWEIKNSLLIIGLVKVVYQMFSVLIVKTIGLVKSHCWSQNLNEYGSLFMVHDGVEVEDSSNWLLDSGSSNHMIAKRELFHQLDEIMSDNVRLGDDKEVDALGKGLIAINVHRGGVILLHGVQYVPNLAYNLLSVG